MVDISALEEVLKPCLTTCEHNSILDCSACEYHGCKAEKQKAFQPWEGLTHESHIEGDAL